MQSAVDAPLGKLFVQAAHSPGVPTGDENRARSASEAFLFRRLQTLPATAGRFGLNVELPIAGKHLDLLLDAILTTLAHCEPHRRR